MLRRLGRSIPSHAELQSLGGCVIRRHALDGMAPLGWAFREEPVRPGDSGQRFLSAIDDDAYLADSGNSVVASVSTAVEVEPAVLALLHLPVGADVTIERVRGRIRLVDTATGREISTKR